MTPSDPMGPNPGRVLLNGNANTPTRFCELACLGAGPSQHRDEGHRAADRVVIITAAWGRGEANDAPLRRGFRAQGRGRSLNLRVFGSMVKFLRDREVVKRLYDEHVVAWQQLYDAYSDENDATVGGLRTSWERAQRDLGTTSMFGLLSRGDRYLPGPPTRPVGQLVEHAYSQQLERHVEALVQADDRRAAVLRKLWDHFHQAAGLEFDSLWHELRHEQSEALLNGSIIALAGGDPGKLLTALRFFKLEAVFAEAVRRGVHVFGSSAGAMVLGARVVVFHDHRSPRQEFALYDNGIGLVQGVQPFPHVNDRLQTADAGNLAYLSARFRHRICVGLNAGSTLGLEATAGHWRMWSAGDEDVVRFGRDGEKHRHAPGQVID